MNVSGVAAAMWASAVTNVSVSVPSFQLSESTVAEPQPPPVGVTVGLGKIDPPSEVPKPVSFTVMVSPSTIADEVWKPTVSVVVVAPATELVTLAVTADTVPAATEITTNP